MKYSSNIENSSLSALTEDHMYNSVSGGPANTATPDQLGINITKSVFGWQTPSKGAATSNKAPAGLNAEANQWIDTYGMPFIFVVNGMQILLPPVVQAGGTPVPYLPDGISVIYAPSFMGVTIPSDFFKPISANGKLRLDKIEVPSATGMYPSIAKCAGGSPSSALLRSNCQDTGINQGNTLLYLIMSVMECLIYSYSSNPWGNGYNDLSDAVMTKRNLDDWLIYPYQKGTFLGNVVKAIAPVYTNVIAPAIAAIVPGSSGAVNASSNAIKSAAANEGKNQMPQQIGLGMTTQLANPGVVYDANGQAVSVASGNSTLLLVALAVLVLIIIIIIARS